MPDLDKKGKKNEKSAEKKNPATSSRDHLDIRKLCALLNVQASKQQLPAIERPSKSEKQPSTPNGRRSRGQRQESTEAIELETFSVNYKNERNFSRHPHHKIFLDIFTALVKNRLSCSEWVGHAPSVHFLRVLICLRLLMRDPFYQEVLHQLGGIDSLARHMEVIADSYLGCGDEQYNVDKLVNMTYIFQKLSAVTDQRGWVIASGAHKTLVKMLAARDNNVLVGALLALTSLAESSQCREAISELSIVENLMMILHEYDLLSKRLTAELLRLLCAEREVKEQVKVYEGVPILLSLLHSDHLKLLWSVVWILVLICEDSEISVEIRIWGGIKQLLHILEGNRSLVSDRSSIGTLSSANAAGRIQQLRLSENLSPREKQENTLSLQAACCAALTELVLNDTNAHQVVQENGVYTIGKLILPSKHKNSAKDKAVLLQCYAFRALRFLFSMERNRELFKRLFPSDLFEIFIDIGHYVREIKSYEELVLKFNSLPVDDLKHISENIEIINQNKAPTKYIGNYAILDHLGSGAFGCVYKVRKRSGQNLLAMKEINLHNPAFGKDKKDRDNSVENIVSELTIIREQLYHPNVVRYYRTFLENDRLYIVMELIEGAPLGDHFNSLKEKQQQFTEERIWNIFIQLCLALRYLHKEKRIVHRDLSPNNIMLGEKDKVTITDFGLAKQKQENSKLTSVVGTILYSCPEVLKSEPYGEKADVWAAGCILYQMATLQPPFYSTNMLSLATKIVEAVYEPVLEGLYSDKVACTIKRCLTPDAETRPDIVEVCALISDVMMKYLDGLSTSQITLEKKLERERKRTQRYFLEANMNALTHRHHLAILPHAHLSTARLSGSSITGSFKSDFSESMLLPMENFQQGSGDCTSDTVFCDDTYTVESIAKDLSSELEEDLDPSDNSSGYSTSPIKESTMGFSSSPRLARERKPSNSLSRPEMISQSQHVMSQTGLTRTHVSGSMKRSVSASEGERQPGAKDSKGGPTSKPRPVPLPLGLFLKAPSLMFRAHAKRPEASLAPGWQSHSLPALVLLGPKDHASAGIAVSQRKVRQIIDPIQQILIQLHKIIYITQLPPALHDNLKRRVIERFKKSLFSLQSNPCNLKSEMNKLLQGSPELIEPNVFTADCHLLFQSLGGNSLVPDDRSGVPGSLEFEAGLTYEQMQTMIEEVLDESGYYNLNSSRYHSYPWGSKSCLGRR
ncbi:serine/threonine-protein kinase Nek10 [Ambystoma mexicanum]|uniref:serine/threonine-protein kinase Nek10 n=1 Tax=Ambystoma mexicanum TaxID=8296 RepID=UPI0037E96B26